MFRLNLANESDRRKLFVLLLLLFSIVGFTARWVFMEINERREKKQVMAAAAIVPMVPQEKEKVPSPAASPSSSSEPVTPEEKEASKQVAIQFIKAYASYDGAQPLLYLEKSNPYMSKGLFQKENEYPRRQTLESERTKVLSTEVYSVDSERSDEVKWNVIAIVEHTSHTGKKMKEESWYWVTVSRDADAWKVAEVGVE